MQSLRPRDPSHGTPGRLLTAAAGALILFLSTGSAQAQVFQMFCAIDAPQETPTNASPATGVGIVTVDTLANQVHFNFTFSGLTGLPFDAHIHGPSEPGVPAGIMFGLPTPNSPIVGTWNYNPAVEPHILWGRTYVNIHTNTFPVGEIRGQIINADSYCFGDGTAAPCASPTPSTFGRGCVNSTGIGGILFNHGDQTMAMTDLGFTAMNLLPAQPALLFSGTIKINGGQGVPFGSGLRCAGGSVVRHGIAVPNGSGVAKWGPGVSSSGAFVPGTTRFFQAWYRDPADPFGSGFNLSNGLGVTF